MTPVHSNPPSPSHLPSAPQFPPANTPAARHRQVIDLLLQGYTLPELCEWIDTNWGGDPGPHIAAAGEHFLQVARDSHQSRLGFCLEATRDVYRRAVQIGDFAVALRAIKQLAELSAAADKVRFDTALSAGSGTGDPLNPDDFE